YTEKTPSGLGFHLISRGALPGDWTGTKQRYHDGAVEIYSRTRFFTMTGNVIRHGITDNSFQDLYRKIKPATNGNGNHKAESTSWDEIEELIYIEDRLKVALRDRKFVQLWKRGDISSYQDDDSRADQS